MRYHINLFPPKEQTIVDKIIYFSFHYLRYILVITQLVIIGVFFYRFKIDQEIVDLKDSLKQKEEIITVSAPLIRDVRTIDTRVKTISGLATEQTNMEAMLTYVLSRFPADLSLIKMDVNQKGMKFEGSTLRPTVVQLFYNQLKKDKQFGIVKLDSLRKGDTGFQFSFTLSNYITSANEPVKAGRKLN